MFTKYGLQQMGFEQLPAGESITAAFHLLRVYSIRGLTGDSDAFHPCVVFDGIGCRFSFGRSVNDLARTLLNDDFTDDEVAWAKEKDVSPPYLMIHVGPTSAVTATDLMHQRRDGAIITHDAFPHAREELKQRESESVESLLVGLAAVFSTRSHPVTFHECGREVFGLNDDGETVFDLRLTVSASGYASSRISSEELSGAIAHALLLKQHLETRVSRFFYLGLSERDPLKRFLYFFLFIERYVHGTFGTLTRAASTDEIVPGSPLLEETRSDLQQHILADTKALLPRFMWCALLSWPGFTDEDVRAFKALKVERDRLSHGVEINVGRDLANRTERLASRLIIAGGPSLDRPER